MVCVTIPPLTHSCAHAARALLERLVTRRLIRARLSPAWAMEPVRFNSACQFALVFSLTMGTIVSFSLPTVTVCHVRMLARAQLW